MSEKILVPLDGSGLGEAALEYVSTMLSRLAPEKRATVYLLHVITTLTHEIDVPGNGLNGIRVPNSDDEMEALRAQSEGYLKKASKMVTAANAEISLQVRTAQNPAAEIIMAEEELGCDLVAMSTHGRSGFSRWAFGSVTEKVLRAGSVPVLMVRSRKNA